MHCRALDRSSGFSPICPSTPCFGMLMEVLVSDSSRLRVSPFLPIIYLRKQKNTVKLRWEKHAKKLLGDRFCHARKKYRFLLFTNPTLFHFTINFVNAICDFVHQIWNGMYQHFFEGIRSRFYRKKVIIQGCKLAISEQKVTNKDHWSWRCTHL